MLRNLMRTFGILPEESALTDHIDNETQTIKYKNLSYYDRYKIQQMVEQYSDDGLHLEPKEGTKVDFFAPFNDTFPSGNFDGFNKWFYLDGRKIDLD